MRKAYESINREQEANQSQVGAPIGGWNALDPVAHMPPLDAIYMIDMFPSTSSVIQRYGYTQYATGLLQQVETIMDYSGGTSRKMFGIAGGNIYNATAGGAVGAADVSSLTNSRFQYVNVATSGGNFMLAVNGADKLQGYDGTSWWVDGDGTHDVTGVNTANCIGISLFKNRVWLVEKDTLNLWYLATSAIAGAATAFPLQGVARRGGYVMAMGAWTMDAGYGVDDMAVFVTSNGEVIVYKGTDPASAATWELVGVWQLGSPIGRRCLYKFGADLLYISQDGLIPMSTGLQSDRLDQRAALTNKIQSAVSSAVVSYGANFGWQAISFPKENMLLLNVPKVTGSSQEQYVMNAITKSWCNFTGWEANCFEIFADNLYFGGNGYIGKAWDGLSDNGININGNVKQAFNFFGGIGEKSFTMIRPTILTDGVPTLLCSVNTDYSDADPTSALSFAPTSYAVWGTSLWDSGTWGAGLNSYRAWKSLNGVGNCAAIRLKTAAMGIRVEWVSTDIVTESKGGIL